MGTLLGYIFGRLRERPYVELAEQLDEHADELRNVVDGLQRENALLWDAVEAAEAVVPMIPAVTADDQQKVERLTAALASVNADVVDLSELAAPAP